MNCTLSASDDLSHIILKFTGEISRHTALEHIEKAHQLGDRLKTDRYLLDLSEARNIDSTTDQYDFVHADLLQSPQVDKYARIAVLVSPDDHSHDFVETVIRNAGFNLKIFHERESALAFLDILSGA